MQITFFITKLIVIFYCIYILPCYYLMYPLLSHEKGKQINRTVITHIHLSQLMPASVQDQHRYNTTDMLLNFKKKFNCENVIILQFPHEFIIHDQQQRIKTTVLTFFFTVLLTRCKHKHQYEVILSQGTQVTTHPEPCFAGYATGGHVSGPEGSGKYRLRVPRTSRRPCNLPLAHTNSSVHTRARRKGRGGHWKGERKGSVLRYTSEHVLEIF